jgi:uncharacterized membrane protein YvlD (DUF360 family)
LLAVNALIVLLTEQVSGWLSIGLSVARFWAAFAGALMISFVTVAASRALHRSPSGPQLRLNLFCPTSW